MLIKKQVKKQNRAIKRKSSRKQRNTKEDCGGESIR
jgi:hypothetical protein